MLTLTNYTALKLLPAKQAAEGKKQPPRTIVVDGGAHYVSVWQSDLDSFKAVAAAGAPIPVTVRSRVVEIDGEPRARADLQFVGGLDLGEEETVGEEIAVGSVGSDD